MPLADIALNLPLLYLWLALQWCSENLLTGVLECFSCWSVAPDSVTYFNIFIVILPIGLTCN